MNPPPRFVTELRRSLCAIALCLWIFPPLLATPPAHADPDRLVNCNHVKQDDRCACNERVLWALAHSRPIVPEAEGTSWSAIELNNMIAMQQLREHRLRTFLAPLCERRDPKTGKSIAAEASPDLPPVPPEPYSLPYRNDAFERHLRPLLANDLPEAGDKLRDLLEGRWEGWLALHGSKPIRTFLYVISVGASYPKGVFQIGTFVKACSDQGMVIGHVKDGYLELTRLGAAGAAYSIRLWESPPPRTRDLEGVAIFEGRPGEALIAGNIWLSRPLKFDWTAPPSTYFCQDRDLEEQRKEAEHPSGSGLDDSLW